MFPETVLGVKVEIKVDDAWTDITDYVYKEKISISRGAADETADSSPTRCQLLLNNIDGRFSPRNPNSPYYGKIGRNTQMLVSILDGHPFLDFPDVGRVWIDNFETPAEIDYRVDAQLFNWHEEPGRVELGSCFDSTGLNGWGLRFDNGALNVMGGRGGDWLNMVSDRTFTVPPSGRVTLRLVIDNTAQEFRFYQGPSVDGPWTAVGSRTFTGDPVTGATARLVFGDWFLGDDYANPAGRLHRFQLRDGEDGNIIADLDVSQQAVGDTSLEDEVGNTWTVTNGASVSNQYNRFRGEISSWPTKWVTGGFDAWEEITAESLLRRQAQGVIPLRSAIVRSTVTRPTLVAYWPMEDSDPSSVLAPMSPDTKNMLYTGDVSLAAHAGPDGSDSLPSFSAGSSWYGDVNLNRFLNVGSWQVQGVFNFQQLTTTERAFFIIRTSGTIREWRLLVDQDSVRVQGYKRDAGGLTLTVDKAFAWTFDVGGAGTMTPGASVNLWQKWQLLVTQVGGTIDWSIAGRILGSAQGTVGDNDISPLGTIGQVSSVLGPFYNADIDGISVGHIAVYYGDDISIFDEAEDGYVGDTALERAQRLADEEGENLVFVGDYGDTVAMGAQRPDRLLDLMRETANTDRGIFGDSRDWSESAFRFIGRASLYNQPPVLELDYTASSSELWAPLDPTDDDQYLRNRVSAERERGGRAITEKSEGVNSVAEVGLYETTVTVNSESDDILPHIAGWDVHIGTWDEERYPTVHLKLHAAPHLIPDYLFVDQGTRIIIRNARSADSRTWVPPGDIELMVRGYDESFGNFEWTADLQCVPARPWDIPLVVPDTTLSSSRHDRVDTAGSVTAGTTDADDTVLPVWTTDGKLWTEDVKQYPFSILAGGEEMLASAPGGLVNANPFFEADLTGWSPTGGTIERVTDIVHPDPAAVASMKFTPPGAVSALTIRCTDMPVTAGCTYRFSMWVYSPNGWNGLCVNAQWKDSGGSVFDSDFVNHDVPAGVWTYLTDDFEAPAGAVNVLVAPRINNTPAATDVFYVWAARGCRITADWANDTFNRTSASSWGEADSGDDWVNAGGSASDYGVGSGYGQHLISTLDVSRRSSIAMPGTDFDLMVDVATSATATGASMFGGLMARYTDIDNLYHARLEFTTAGTMTVSVRKRLAGTETGLVPSASVGSYSAATFYRMRFQGDGDALRIKVWPAADPEPTAWSVETTDSDLSATRAGCRSIAATGNTNVSPAIRYDNFRVLNPQVLGVERSRNRVVKAHVTGETVRLTHPAHTAL